jgi:hypothetical protein
MKQHGSIVRGMEMGTDIGITHSCCSQLRFVPQERLYFFSCYYEQRDCIFAVHANKKGFVVATEATRLSARNGLRISKRNPIQSVYSVTCRKVVGSNPDEVIGIFQLT